MGIYVLKTKKGKFVNIESMSRCLGLIVGFEFDPIFQSWLMVDVHGGS